MHQVFYAGITFVTGDDLARALLSVVTRAANSGRTEAIELPCRSIDGVIAQNSPLIVTLVVVAHTPVIAVHLDEVTDELIDEVAVARLRSPRADSIAVPQEQDGSFLEPGAFYDFDEWM